ncbi:MAG: alpha/beta fold hydrolase [Dehalococcoidia bacterium]
MMQAHLNGITLYYEDHGSGLPLVLTHGIGSSADNWANVLPLLAQNHRVITWDVRGFGRSEKPEGPYSAQLWASDLAALLDTLGLKQPCILGHSMGGVIAQRFALDFPEKLSALILVSTSSQVNEKAAAFWFGQADTIEREGFAAWIKRQQEGYSEEFLNAHPQQLEYDRRRVEMNDSRAYAAGARAVASYNFTDELRRINVPTLIVQGLVDTQTPPGGSVIISRNIPGSQLVMLDGVGHGVHSEQPEKFVQLVAEFLRHIERPLGLTAPTETH